MLAWMKQVATVVAAVLAFVAGFAALAVVASWAPRWAWQIAIGIGCAMFFAEQWQRRLASKSFLSQGTRRRVVAAGLVLVFAAISVRASGVWAAGGFVAAIGAGDVHRRRAA